MMKKKSYPSDLTDAEWELLAPLIPPAENWLTPFYTGMREVTFSPPFPRMYPVTDISRDVGL
jgi:transposase